MLMELLTATSAKSGAFVSVEKEMLGKIMKTDVFVKVVGLQGERVKIERDINEVFRRFEDFSNRFSRFISQSELMCFNASTGGQISPELFSLLKVSKKYYQETDGIFNPAVLTKLHELGYEGAEIAKDTNVTPDPTFDDLILEEKTLTAKKPANLFVDLGGIGKGFVVDDVARFLCGCGYENFVVDAGGDIYAAGTNQEEHYPYWAFDIENPQHKDEPLATVLLSNEAVATSGRNRRTWEKEGKQYHHLIDPRQGTSAGLELLTVSVVAPTTMDADVFAKTIFILGEEQGLSWAEENKIPALLVRVDGGTVSSSTWKSKTWQG